MLTIFPRPDIIPHSRIEAPIVILAHETYPFLPYLIKQYKLEGLTDTKRIFNNHVSRARKTVWCAFVITSGANIQSQ